jgi:hypothetical protein
MGRKVLNVKIIAMDLGVCKGASKPSNLSFTAAHKIEMPLSQKSLTISLPQKAAFHVYFMIINRRV